MQVSVTRGFVLANSTGKNLVVQVTSDEDSAAQVTTSVTPYRYSEGILLSDKGFKKEGKLNFSVKIGKEEFPAITLAEIRYSPGGEANIIEITELNNVFIISKRSDGVSSVHFYNSAAVVASFEEHIVPVGANPNDVDAFDGGAIWESSRKAVGQAVTVDLKTLGLKDITLLTQYANVFWGKDSINGPVLYSKTSGGVAGYELRGTAFSTDLDKV